MQCNLKSKILVPSLGILLFLMFLSAILMSHYTVEQLKENTLDIMRASNTLLVKHVHESAENYLSMIEAIASMQPIQQLTDIYDYEFIQEMRKDIAIKQTQSLIYILPRLFPIYKEFYFAQEDGLVVAGSNTEFVNTLNVRRCIFFNQCINGNTYISEPFFSKILNDKAIVVAIPLKSDLQRITAVFFALVPCKNIYEATIKDAKMSKGGYSYLVDGKSGLMLSHYVMSKIQTMNMFEYQPWMRSVKLGESGYKLDYHDSQGQSRIAVYEREPTSGWIVVSCIPWDDIEEQSDLLRNRIITLMICCTIGIAVVLSYVLNQVIKDVVRVSAYAQAVAEGNYDEKLNFQRKDELGSLVTALKNMVSSLKTTIRTSFETNMNFMNATQSMYSNIYQIDLTDDCFAKGSKEREFASIKDLGELPYSEAVVQLAKRNILDEYQSRFTEVFSRENLINSYNHGIQHIELECPVKLNDEISWLHYDGQIFFVKSEQHINMYLYAKNISHEVDTKMRAKYDALTGCLTRGELESEIKKKIIDENTEKFAFIILDIDNFKNANDKFGHQFGDYCLKRFTEGIRQEFRRDDIIGRMGGDEFIVFIPYLDENMVEDKARSLVQTLNIDCIQENAFLHISASVGISLYPKDGMNMTTLYKNADAALYMAKWNGKNGFYFYNPEVVCAMK